MDDPGTEALRKLAPQWSLAGDEQLLTILQNTHQRLLSKCHETNSQLEQMATALNDASVRLQNVNNQFMALSSSQFIESRVYDDDDVVSTEPAVKEPPQPSPADELSSIKLGLGVLEAAHEGITILHDSDTDSDSEDDLPNRLVLKPRDMYADRPLPYIIGSQPWKTKWHAGLVVEDSDSDSSTSKLQDSEQYSSEQEDSPHRVMVPDTHTTISEASSSLPSEPGSLPKSAADVATDIARRLGGTEPTKVEQDPVYEEPVKPTTRKVYRPQDPVVSTVFPESPPPLSRSGSADSSASDIFAELHRPAYSERQGHDLFDFPDEGDIFSDFAKPSEQAKPTSLFEAGPTPNMFKTQPQVTVNQHTDTQAEKGVKKPVGGISLFGKKDTESIGAAILKRNQRKSSASGDESGSDVKTEPKHHNEQTKTEKDIFDDLFARSEPKKVVKDKVNIVKDIQKEIVKKNEARKEKDKIVVKEKVDLFSDNLFDDIDDIFSTNVVKMPTNSNTKSIFDDDDDLFSEIAAPKEVKNEASSSKAKRETIFDSEDELFSENVSKTNERFVKVEKPIIKENSKIVEPAKSLFEEDDDIFNDEKETNTLKDTKINTIQETKKINEQKELKPSIVTSFKSPSLFGDDDDDNDIFNNTKTPNDNKILNDDKSNKNNEIKTKIENKNNNLDNVKINNNVINEIIEDKNLSVEENVASKKLPREATVEKPFKISKLLNKVRESSSDTNDDFSDQDFDDVPPKPKNIENINAQSIFDNDLDIDMFKERNKIEKIEDKDTYKIIKDNLDKEDDMFSEDFFKDAKEIVDKDKYVFKDIKDDSSMEPNTPKETFKDNVEKDENIFKDIKGNASTEPNTPKDTLKDIKDEKQKYKDISKEIKGNIPTGAIEKEPILFEKTEQDNNKNNEIVSTTITASIFTDILSEPPVFEKPKEPKKSKNVNALFDDDSDDESLFFKKEDVISDEKPPDFKPAQDRLFGLFTDEPPDDDFKVGSDDDIFSSLPKPKIPQSRPTTVVENVKITIPTNNLQQTEKIVTVLPERETTVESTKLPNSTTEKSDDKVPIFEKLDSKLPENLEPNVVTNLPKAESTVETLKPPISIIEKSKEKIPIYEKLDSRNLENFESDLLSANDLFTKEFKPVKNKKIDFLPGEDNLFEPPEDNIPLPKESPLENIIKDTNDLFYDSTKAESLKKDLNSEDNLFKIPKTPISDIKRSNSEENTDLPEKAETKKVGKLKLGLNINVNALLPGASPKKTKVNDQTDGQAQSQAQIPDTKASPDPDLPKTVGFDGNPDSEVLDNKLSKERPRIQVKRRPSTRRARKEAVRKSGIDFGEDSTDNSSSIDDPPKHTKNETEIPKTENQDQIDGEIRKNSDEIEDLDKTHTQIETQAEMQAEIQPDPEQDEIIRPIYKRDVTSKIVYILNDEDIFNSPIEKTDTIEKSENLDSNVDTNPGVSTLGQVYEKADKVDTKSSLFNNDENDDGDEIFKGKIDKKKTIFDSDSDEELFGSKKEKVKVKEVRKEIKDIKVKGSLFGDESDDDDLFGVKTKKVVEPKPQPQRSAKEASKPSAPVFEDPLSMFGNDD